MLWQLPGLPAADKQNPIKPLGCLKGLGWISWITQFLSDGKNILKQDVSKISANGNERGWNRCETREWPAVPRGWDLLFFLFEGFRKFPWSPSSAQEILRSDVSGFESTNYETCNQQKTIEEEGCVVYNTLDSKQEKKFSSISFDHPVMAVMDILRFGGTKNRLLSTFMLDVTRDDRDKHAAPKTEANKIIQTAYVKWIRYYRLTTPILTYRTMKRVTKPGQTQAWTFSSLIAWESWCYRVRLWIWWQKLDISHILHTWFFITTYSTTKSLVNNITGPSSRPGWLSVASWHSPVVTSNGVEACSFRNNKGIVFAKLRPIVNRCDSTPTKITSWDSWQRTGPTHSFFFRKESSLSSWPSSPARCTQQCPEMLTSSQREEHGLTHKYSNNATGRYRKVWMPSCLPSSSTGVWACWIFFLPPQQKIHRVHWKIRVVCKGKNAEGMPTLADLEWLHSKWFPEFFKFLPADSISIKMVGSTAIWRSQTSTAISSCLLVVQRKNKFST